jgi:hypothetical protein
LIFGVASPSGSPAGFDASDDPQVRGKGTIVMTFTDPMLAELIYKARLQDCLDAYARAQRLRELKSESRTPAALRRSLGSAMVRAGTWVAGDACPSFADCGQQLALDC